jgi:hypothetical protein
MISLRLAVPAVLVAAAVAGCFTYFVTPPPPPPPPQAVEADHRLQPTAPDTTGANARSSEEQAAAFQQAAQAILKHAPDAQASAATDEPPIVGHIPLPKRRPIPPKEIPPAKPNE